MMILVSNLFILFILFVVFLSIFLFFYFLVLWFQAERNLLTFGEAFTRTSLPLS